MSNGQGLPVMYYCGGYNCRHRWVAWSGKKDKNGIFVSDSVDKGKKTDGTLNTTVEGIYKQNYAAGVAIKKHKQDAVIEMSGNEVNMRSQTGDVDLIVDGVKTEVKTPRGVKPTSVVGLLVKGGFDDRQSNDYIIHFPTKEPPEIALNTIKRGLIEYDDRYFKEIEIKILSNNKYRKLYE